MRHRLHHAQRPGPGDRYHREGWNDALESLEDAVLDELGEVVTREDVLREIRALMDYPDGTLPDESKPF